MSKNGNGKKRHGHTHGQPKKAKKRKDMNAGAAVLAGERRPQGRYQEKILERRSLRVNARF